MTKAKQTVTPENDPLGSVFGFEDYTGGIVNPGRPYAIRFNCKTGAVHKTETRRICDDYKCSVIKVEKYFGDLGKTKGAEWMQLFTIPHPDQEFVPANTVVVCYVKKESLTLFSDRITEIIASGKNPASGIFTFTFDERRGEKGPYFVVQTDWDERKTPNEMDQLEQIRAFMSGPMVNHLVDMDSTRDMIATKSLDAEQLGIVLYAYGQGLSPQRSLRAAMGEDVGDLVQEAIAQRKREEQLA